MIISSFQAALVSTALGVFFVEATKNIRNKSRLENAFIVILAIVLSIALGNASQADNRIQGGRHQADLWMAYGVFCYLRRQYLRYAEKKAATVQKSTLSPHDDSTVPPSNNP